MVARAPAVGIARLIVLLELGALFKDIEVLTIVVDAVTYLTGEFCQNAQFLQAFDRPAGGGVSYVVAFAPHP